jgi:hypothetical protein
MALTRMQQRRGSAAQWTTANTTLASGEIGVEVDTNRFKVGDGLSAWSALAYFENQTDVAAAIQSAVDGILDLPPATLDTLNELSAALGDDPDFFNTVVYKAGSTMTGDLTLANDPTSDLHAATKQYVDNLETLESGGITGQVLSKSSNDDFDVEWVTAAYDLDGLSDVDTTGVEDKNTLVYDVNLGQWVAGPGGGKFAVFETPPAEALNGDTWLDSATGNTYIYYEDYDNSQWIQFAGPGTVGARGSKFSVQTTTPLIPVSGDVWYDPSSGFTYLYYVDTDSSQWIQFGLNRSGAKGTNGTNGAAGGADGADGADGAGVIAGGASGQAAVKASSTDYDMAWADIPTTLDDLSDTEVSSPSHLDSLAYDSGTGKWASLTAATVPIFQTSFVSVNFNDASWTQQPVFDTTPLINVGGFSVTSSDVTVPTDGYYFISYNIFFTSAGERANPGVAVGVNGVRGEEIRSAHSYIRAANGHDESTANASGILLLSASDTLHIYGVREALSASTDSSAGIGSFNVYRIS